MNVIYDDIVYSLQKAGGISVMWSQITNSVPYPAKHIQYDNARNNMFGALIEGHEYDIRSAKGLQLKRFLNLKFDEQNPFIFHSSYFRYCKNANAINVTNVYDFIYEYYAHNLKSMFHKLQKKESILHSDGVICISECTKRDLKQFCPNYSGEIKVIYCGYDRQTFFYEKLPKEKYILCVGGRNGCSRFDYTIDILKYLPDCKLILVGGGPITENEYKLLESTIPNRYEKVGYLNNDELRRLYNKAFLLSYCSDYEGFGIPPIEAQACGCPVVCQAKASLPEVVQDSAIIFDATNIEATIIAIKKLYKEDYYYHLVQKGLANVKRFSWEKCKREVYEFYDFLLKKNGLI